MMQQSINVSKKTVEIITSVRNNNPKFSGGESKQGRKPITEILEQLIASRPLEQLAKDCKQTHIVNLAKSATEKDDIYTMLEFVSHETFHKMKSLKSTHGIAIKRLIMLMYYEELYLTDFKSEQEEKLSTQKEQVMIYKCVHEELQQMSLTYKKNMAGIISVGLKELVNSPKEITQALIPEIKIDNGNQGFAKITIDAIDKTEVKRISTKYNLKNKSYFFKLIMLHYERIMRIYYK
ncbi:MAG: hypothetical protein ACRCY4_01540 [Brevinema sp.]